MTDPQSPAIHATVVAIGRWGVAIMGPSASGKSDLALQLIDRGAKLVSDDYVTIASENCAPVARAGANLEGKIEIRGIGIFAMDYLDRVPVRLCVELGDEGDRLLSKWPVTNISGFAIPVLKLRSFTASAPLKVEFALQSLVDADHWPVPSFASRKAQ